MHADSCDSGATGRWHLCAQPEGWVRRRRAPSTLATACRCLGKMPKLVSAPPLDLETAHQHALKC